MRRWLAFKEAFFGNRNCNVDMRLLSPSLTHTFSLSVCVCLCVFMYMHVSQFRPRPSSSRTRLAVRMQPYSLIGIKGSLAVKINPTLSRPDWRMAQGQRAHLSLHWRYLDEQYLASAASCERPPGAASAPESTCVAVALPPSPTKTLRLCEPYGNSECAHEDARRHDPAFGRAGSHGPKERHHVFDDAVFGSFVQSHIQPSERTGSPK